MSAVQIGDIIKTSYGYGPYIVCSIINYACTCPKFNEWLDKGDAAPHSRPHLHLKVKRPDCVNYFWLNGYDPETLKSVWNNDSIIVLKKSAQAELNFGVPS